MFTNYTPLKYWLDPPAYCIFCPPAPAAVYSEIVQIVVYVAPIPLACLHLDLLHLPDPTLAKPSS